MIKPRPYEFYSLGTYLHPLMILRGGLQFSGNESVRRLFTYANIGLCLFKGDVFAKKYLPSSHEKAESLYSRIQEDFTKLTEPWDPVLVEYKVQNLQGHLTSFETTLEDELSKVPIFCCEEDSLGNLSVDKLLSGAHKGYPANVRVHASKECLAEIDEAGRCLVYERSTASGFHILRAVEMMILIYLKAVPGFVIPSINRQSWGEYIRALKDNGADKPTIDQMQNLKDNHRNPLMHPQDTLTMPEGVSLFAVCQSAIETIVADGEKRGTLK